MKRSLGLALLIAIASAGVARAVTWETAAPGAFYTTASVSDPVIRDNARAGLWISGATGFLISPDGYFLTNYHVGCELLSGVSGQCAPSATAYVGYTDAGAQYRIVGSLVDADLRHDFALYKANGHDLPWVRCRTESTPFPAGEAVCAIGHPSSWPQRVSFGTMVRADAELPPRVTCEYTCQTEPGSSGSMICARDGRVVALHWGWDAGGTLDGELCGIPMHRLIWEVPSVRDVVLNRTGGGDTGPANPPTYAGLTGAWGAYNGSLAGPGSASALDLVFTQGNTVTLALQGDPSSDVDLYLLDEQGHVVADSRSPGPDEWITFPVARSGVYRVLVLCDAGSGSFWLWARNS